MKRIITSISFLILLIGAVQSQTVPQGMNYQAVARDHKGQILANQPLELSVQLYADADPGDVVYRETHRIQTSELGLFNMIIGTGEVIQGRFEAVPWSTSEIWMEVAIRKGDDENFVVLTNSQMLSVPYAFHAATAGELSGSAGGERGGTNDPFTKVWHIQGNTGTNPSRDKLGTGDFADLVIVTTSEERMRIMRTGEVMIREDLHAGQNVYLNLPDSNFMLGQPDLMPIGHTINYGDFTVENQSNTLLTGALHVNGNTQLDQKLNVDGLTTVSYDEQSFNPSKGAFTVAGGAGISKNLNVGGSFGLTGDATMDGLVRMKNSTQSTSPVTGALVVDGGVGIGKNLNVGGTTTLGDLEVKGNKPSFVASFENTNDGTGDGIVIKLGKTHPAWDGNDTLHVTSPASETVDDIAETMLQILRDGDLANLNPVDFIQYYPPLVQVDMASSLFNTVTGAVNQGLGLPWTDRQLSVWFNGHDPVLCELKEMKANGGIDWEALEEPFSSWQPPYNTEAFKNELLAKLDAYDCPDCWDDTYCNGLDGFFEDDELYYNDEWSVIIPEIPKIPMISGFLPEFSDMNLSFSSVNNSLTGENQFISFKDKDGRELGSIRAMSVDEWVDNSLKDILVNLSSQAIGFDVVNGAFNVLAGFTEVADSYNSLGVEYASGNGDYAEWLERVDPKEVITEGNIVGVIGGKITRDLRNAEQVLAVSGRPIMLGNVPEKGKEGLGNKVAFLGQIPVKIIGPVSSGDYIVGNPSTPGYGIAVHPADMTPDQVRVTVGRAWDTHLSEGPKMVNTVIGVDNGAFLNLLRDQRSAIDVLSTSLNTLNAQVHALESRLESFMSGSGGYAEVPSRQKSKKSESLK